MQPNFPPILRQKLDRLKRLLRFYAALDGFVLLLLTVIMLFVLDVALDRFFEFPWIVRCVLLPVLFGIIGFVCVKKILFRCFAGIRRDQLATTFEHFVPRLNEALVTSVEWDGSGEADPELLQQTIDEAAAALRNVRVFRFFRTARLLSRLFYTLLAAALVAAGCLYYSETISLWYARNILLAQREYPRRSQLFADGFQDGRVRIGRGDSFVLAVRANMEMPLVPESIRVRIGTPEADYRTVRIDQFRVETREGTRWRVFSTTFPEMLESVNLHIRAADSALNDLCIEVVPTPTLTDMVLNQKFPEYMQRPERAVALTGRAMIPDGTGVTITAKSTKPLRTVSATVNQQEQSLTPHSGEPFDSVSLTLPELREDATVEFRLTDIDLLSHRHPIRVELGIVKDQPPVVTARLEGIGPAITPDAVVPMVGEITDDNGLATAISRYTTEPAVTLEESETPARKPTEGTAPITGIASGQTLFPLEQTFSVLPLSVLPDDKLTLFIEAGDSFNLDETEGQTGTGPRWQMEIVTPEKLKSLLETREIALRHRFEVVIEEVERTKNILLEFTLQPMEQQIQQAEALTLEEKENDTEAEKEVRQRELDAKKKTVLDSINAEQSELGKYHITRMLRDVHKEIYDLTGIVDSFRTIRAEMINNRIFSEDERKRIDQAVIHPMRELCNADFPGIDTLLGILNMVLSDRDKPNRPSALEERQKILVKIDETLLKMRTIRDNMASMESFSEAVELLRSIIKQQQLLRNETIEEQKQRLRNLLD